MNSILSTNLRRGLVQSVRSHNSKGQRLSSISQRATCIIAFDENNNNANPSVNVRSFSSLPYHLVVGMPALSPTMEGGSIASWNVKEGDSFGAGDSLAEIETDKATMDFEAQDDGYVAKILADAGGDEILVGAPIMVTVDFEEDIAAFKDFVPPEADQAAPTPEPEPEPVVEETPPIVAAPEPVVEAVAPEPAPVVEAVPEPAVASVETEVQVENVAVVSPGWGNFAKVRSPLASTLSASQKKYIELYGSTGQVPI